MKSYRPVSGRADKKNQIKKPPKGGFENDFVFHHLKSERSKWYCVLEVPDQFNS